LETARVDLVDHAALPPGQVLWVGHNKCLLSSRFSTGETTPVQGIRSLYVGW
jgi:hypothetical protein